MISRRLFSTLRLAKRVAQSRVCSRRQAEKWIIDGRVAVGGIKVTDPAFQVAEETSITVDDAPLLAPDKTRLFVHNKLPRVLVTHGVDERGRTTLFSALKKHVPELPALISIGRLDYKSEGLLLLTNDGALARDLELPSSGLRRKYQVLVRYGGPVATLEKDAGVGRGARQSALKSRLEKALKGLAGGRVVNGVKYRPVESKVLRVTKDGAWVELTLREGKNREIRKLLEHTGFFVTRLIRTQYGARCRSKLTDLGLRGIQAVSAVPTWRHGRSQPLPASRQPQGQIHPTPP